MGHAVGFTEVVYNVVIYRLFYSLGFTVALFSLFPLIFYCSATVIQYRICACKSLFLLHTFALTFYYNTNNKQKLWSVFNVRHQHCKIPFSLCSV